MRTKTFDLKPIKAGLAAATKPPFKAHVDNQRECYKITDVGPTQDHDGDGSSEWIADVYDANNAALFVIAPEWLAQLVAEVERLQVVNMGLQARIEQLGSTQAYPKAPCGAFECDGAPILKLDGYKYCKECLSIRLQSTVETMEPTHNPDT